MSDLMTINEGPNITVTATSGVTPLRGHRLTMASDGTVGLAGLAISGEYVATYDFPAAAATETVRFLNAQGTQVMKTTAAAVAVGDSVYSAASGVVSNTATNAILLGIAKTAIGSGGGLIIVVPTP
jgi:hypothetical protein